MKVLMKKLIMGYEFHNIKYHIMPSRKETILLVTKNQGCPVLVYVKTNKGEQTIRLFKSPKMDIIVRLFFYTVYIFISVCRNLEEEFVLFERGVSYILDNKIF